MVTKQNLVLSVEYFEQLREICGDAPQINAVPQTFLKINLRV
jgi:hypothetical protein